jgi:hypothetical protein
METEMVRTRNRTPSVDDAALPERKRAKSGEPLPCPGKSAFECQLGHYRDDDMIDDSNIKWLVYREHGKQEVLKNKEPQKLQKRNLHHTLGKSMNVIQYRDAVVL